MRRHVDSQAVLFHELSENPWPSKPYKSALTPREEPTAGLTALELCAGGGGQSLGYEDAGFEHAGLVEIDKHACMTLRTNRPDWCNKVFEQDLNTFDGSAFRGVDIISGGLPCPPFSVAGKQLGANDERNLFPAMIRLVDQIRPKAVMIENVRGILDDVFANYRSFVRDELRKLGYQTGWKLMNASDFGVSQLRPRAVFAGIQSRYAANFFWPDGSEIPETVGEKLFDLMASNGWKGAIAWRKSANAIAPTVVGGSHKHGGPDLGPTRARRAWASLGVDGLGIADEAPGPSFSGTPKLTIRMVARLQGFPDAWHFSGGKTAAYRQVGNAFPPPFARAIAKHLRVCLTRPKLVRVAG